MHSLRRQFQFCSKDHQTNYFIHGIITLYTAYKDYHGFQKNNLIKTTKIFHLNQLPYKNKNNYFSVTNDLAMSG